ncbi:MAG: M23 family metallopeptidase [Balneolaceae bacterium]|nr:MAG: M23 family metallopeptidase [Balneolaceae bacterium]
MKGLQLLPDITYHCWRHMCGRKRFLSALFSLLFLIPSSVTGQNPVSFLADSVSYLWPTDASRQLSSTFAETRSAHLHAGIDIRTWGREGYKVFATRSGYVYRIGMSPRGYGNVVYMRHPDGSFSVYAHLNRFEPRLQAFADSIRLIDFTADLDIHPDSSQFTYSQGDVIAFTGSTGVGPPHLHFELRDPDYNPFNPLLTNLGIRDRIPPVFTHLAIEHLDNKTLRRTGHDIITGTRSGRNHQFGEITLQGPAGLAVSLYDQADGSPNRYSVYSLALVHETDTLFHAVKDHFSYREARHMFLDRSYQLLAQTRRAYQRLYRVEGNHLPFYRSVKNEGVINFEPGTYNLEIVATDIYGNSKTAFITVHVENNKRHGSEITYVPAYPLPEHHQSSTIPLNPFRWSDYRSDHNHHYLVSAENHTIPFVKIYRPFYQPTTYRVEKILEPGKKYSIHSADRKLWLTVPENALFDSLELHLEIEINDDEIYIHFDPDRLPIQQPIDFNYILPDHMKYNQKLALFSHDKYRNRTFFLGAVNQDGLIRGRLSEISSLKIMQDGVAPWAGTPRIEKNLNEKYIVVVPARDQQTGIDYRRSVITVNGQRGIIEYDPEKNFLIFYHPEFKPKSSNRVSMEIFDGVGNLNRREVTVSY